MFVVRARNASHSTSIGSYTASGALKIVRDFEDAKMLEIECMDEDDVGYTSDQLKALIAKRRPL